ncbi:MAG: hypothetical protein LC637_05345 [Xanthomonadaceae bacterium]|nr:hypothetical protein [Xanthomonadaceae bacterium]
MSIGLLSACAVEQQGGPQKSAQSARDSAAGLAYVAGLLEGRYAGVASTVSNEQTGIAGQVPDPVLVRMAVQVVEGGAEGVVVRLEQRSDDAAARIFRLTFRPSALATRLIGRFAPLDAQGRELGSCPIEIQIRENGFVARTAAESCAFGHGQTTSLVKEIAHDGQTMVIGDRVLDSDSGRSMLPDQILELERVHSFRGWIGVRETDEGPWRINHPIELDSDGGELRPDDAAGMSMGIALDLAPYRARRDEPPVLRLRAFDLETGTLLGQAWTDLGATRIGIALSGLQVGLALSPTGR